jgi:hypothetical protein
MAINSQIKRQDSNAPFFGGVTCSPPEKKWQRIPNEIVLLIENVANGREFIQCQNRQPARNPTERGGAGHFSGAISVLFRAGSHGFPEKLERTKEL